MFFSAHRSWVLSSTIFSGFISAGDNEDYTLFCAGDSPWFSVWLPIESSGGVSLEIDEDKSSSRTMWSSLPLLSVILELSVLSDSTEVTAGCVWISCWLIFDFVQFTKRCSNPFCFRSSFLRSFLIRWTTSHRSSSDTKGSLQQGHSCDILKANFKVVNELNIHIVFNQYGLFTYCIVSPF